MNKMQIARTVALLLPDAVNLVRALVERFGRDDDASPSTVADRVRGELRRIQNHGARLEHAETELDERVRIAAEKRARGG